MEADRFRELRDKIDAAPDTDKAIRDALEEVMHALTNEDNDSDDEKDEQ